MPALALWQILALVLVSIGFLFLLAIIVSSIHETVTPAIRALLGMWRARFTRLARELESREGDGSLGPRGQRTWDRVIRAAARRQRQLDRWDRWRQGRGAGRALAWLSGGLRLAPGDEIVSVPHAALWRHAAASRRALGASLVRHGLTPRDPADRAAFYAITGQGAQRRALDPGGTLLAAAYRRAQWNNQPVLREALIDAGDLEVLRKVAGTGSGAWFQELTGAEWDDLTARLASHHDWAGLWKLARDLPVLRAASTVVAIDRGWQPDSQRDRELFTLLAGGDPVALRRAQAAFGSYRELRDLPVMALAGKPQAAWLPADLAAALSAAPAMEGCPDARLFYDLLLRCLEHRYGGDVRLGHDAPRIGADEIGISRQDAK
jgi:hypothetical protein